jgi:hypothetical protein
VVHSIFAAEAMLTHVKDNVKLITMGIPVMAIILVIPADLVYGDSIKS